MTAETATGATSLRHQFLLAMPGLADSEFGGTIIYLCEHSADGAMGLVVNRASELTLVELLAQLGMRPRGVTVDIPVMDGGPVARDRGFILHSADRHYDASLDLGEGLVLTASREALEAIAEGRGPERFLVALGFAGWGPGQLEQELMENAWLSCPADAAVLFDAPFDQRVARAASSLGIDFNLLSGQAGHA